MNTATKFVVQKHLARRAGIHFDFRFEENAIAPSWAIPKNFSKDKRRIAIQVEDHTVPYMDFEGVIPSGYGAGEVEIWEKGTLILDERTPDLVRFHVDEGKIKGYWLLMRQDGTKWLLSSDVQLSVDKTKESKRATVIAENYAPKNKPPLAKKDLRPSELTAEIYQALLLVEGPRDYKKRSCQRPNLQYMVCARKIRFYFGRRYSARST